MSPTDTDGTIVPATASDNDRGFVSAKPNRSFTVENFREECKAWDDWDKPASPYRIMGHAWYVGTCGISSILLASEDGHILIDSGTEEGAQHVLANIGFLGFDPRDVRFLLHSHEHHDHVGGHAAIVRATGAQVVASPAAAEVLQTGRVGETDPQQAIHPAMAPVQVARVMADGEVLSLGPWELTAHLTPGHSPGSMSWSWWAASLPNEPPVSRKIVYADSASAVSGDAYRFTGNPDYVARFSSALDTLGAIYPCDVLITPHPAASGPEWPLQWSKPAEPTACALYATKARRGLDARLAKERADSE